MYGYVDSSGNHNTVHWTTYDDDLHCVRLTLYTGEKKNTWLSNAVDIYLYASENAQYIGAQCPLGHARPAQGRAIPTDVPGARSGAWHRWDGLVLPQVQHVQRRPCTTRRRSSCTGS